jgi:hypothetical protein
MKEGDRVRYTGMKYGMPGRKGTVMVVGRGSGVTTGQCKIKWDNDDTLPETSWEPFSYEPTVTVIDAVSQLGEIGKFLPTNEDAGRSVIYVPYPGAKAEDGVITSVNDDYVFVRYAGDNGSKATAYKDLQWLSP